MVKKCSDLAFDVRENLIHRVDLIVARVPGGHGEDFLVSLKVVNHVENPDRTDFDQTAGDAGFVHQYQHVHRIAVVRKSPGINP